MKKVTKNKNRKKKPIKRRYYDDEEEPRPQKWEREIPPEPSFKPTPPIEYEPEPAPKTEKEPSKIVETTTTTTTLTPPVPDNESAKVTLATIPKNRVFEKQFIILIAIVAMGTAVFAFNPYLILQGQNTIQQIAKDIQSITNNAVEQNGKIIKNQNENRILLVQFYKQQREEQNAVGEIWLKFINAMLLDLEQQQDEMGLNLGFNLTDRVKTNGTHITFGNETIAILNGIPNVTLTTGSKNDTDVD